MDFLNPHKKRAHTIRLMIGYLLVAIALAMGTLILVLLSYGYDLDRKTGVVIQNGIVFVGAQPASADIYLNGKRQSSRTNTKLVVPAGPYSLQLKRDGYREWLHTFTLQGGSVEHIDYPLLFPKNLVTKDVELYSSMPSFSTQSPDRHWLVTQQVGQLLKFDVMDLSNDNTPITTLTLPANLVTVSNDPNQTWHLVEWSTDNRHVLLRHHFADSDEFVMVDRETPDSSFNVGLLFGLTPSNVSLRDKRFDQLYLYNNQAKTLQIGDVKAVKLTPLLTHVLSFKPHDDKTILYVSDESSKPNQVSLKLYSDGKIYSLRQLTASDRYLLEVARYDGRWYMVATASNEGRTYIYRDPENSLRAQTNSNATLLPAITLAINNPEFLSFSDSARFIAVQSGAHFAVYDAESDRRFYYDITPGVEAGHQATWMDSNRLTVINKDKVQVFDFDGTNEQTLIAANPNFPPFFDRDYKWLYTFAPSITVNGRAAITRTDLIVK